MTTLIKYEQARHALAVCKQVDEVKDWADKAAAMQAYGRMAKDKELEVDAAEIRIRAERRLGELIAAQKAGPGLNRGSAGSGSNQHQVRSSVATAPTLADAGISKDLSSRAQAIAAVPEQEFEQEIGDWRERVTAEGARVSARLEAKGATTLDKTTAPPSLDDLDDDAMPTLEEIVDEQTETIRTLQDQVAALSAGDQPAEMLRQIQLCQHYRREIAEEQAKNARLFKDRADLSRWQSQIILATGAEDPRAALVAIRQKFQPVAA